MLKPDDNSEEKACGKACKSRYAHIDQAGCGIPLDSKRGANSPPKIKDLAGGGKDVK